MSRSKGARCAKTPKSSKAGSLSTGCMSGPRRQWKMALGERVAPDIGEIDWPRDRAVQLLGKCHITFRRANVPFIKNGLAGIWQDLIDAATEHNVAAQEQGGDPGHSKTVVPEDLEGASAIGLVGLQR
jgi:hypothetical protein